MDIQKINSFLTLSKTKSFSKAADELYLSQPALSKQIRSLENELKVPLFHRGRKMTTLTVQGEYFLPYAEDILATYYNSKEHIKQIEDLESGSLIFGATNFNGIYLVPRTLAVFKKKYKNIGIDLTINSSKNLINLLERRQLEFIILSDYIAINENKFKRVKWLEDELQIIVGKESELYYKDYVTLEELKDKLFVTKEKNSSIYRYITSQLGIEFENKLFISSQEAIKYSVVNDLGFSIMSKRSTKMEEELGLLKSLPLKDHSLIRAINIVYEKNKHLTPAALEYFNLLKVLADL